MANEKLKMNHFEAELNPNLKECMSIQQYEDMHGGYQCGETNEREN